MPEKHDAHPRSSGSAPPSITVPPPKQKPQTNPGAAFNQFVNRYTALRPYADLIWKWSRQYGLDAVELAALIFFESRGNPNARSGANALGLAQIHMPTWQGERVPFGVVNERNARNPAFSVRFAAWYLSQNKQKYGSFEAAYRQGYNPGYTGEKGPWSLLPPGYVPRSGALSPSEAASTSVERAGEKATLTDPWVVVSDGKVRFVNSPNPPKNVAKGFGLPVRRSEFERAFSHYNDLYQAYAARNAKPIEVAQLLRKGWSDHAVTVALSKQPTFVKSPVWQASAPQYLGIVRTVMGEPKPGQYRDLVRKAIVNNWGEGSFLEALRKRPEYLASNEYKNNYAGNANMYRSIQGEPDEVARERIKQASLQRKAPDQFAAELRSAPEYQMSPEYQGKALSFLEQLGFVLGGRPTLPAQKGQAGLNG